ncbi:MAG TPA: hypothetical protein VEF76_13275 [Patescibacteria group bacterium]|nr:hypothetical protein [Patescibacteria group bacterium]
MKKTFVLSCALLAVLAAAGCNMRMRDSFAPAEQMSYAPSDDGYVGYVNDFTGTDTHHFKTGDRSFVMRGTPPLSGVVEPWYNWNDISNVGSKAVSFNDCGKCNLAMGAEAEVMTRNLRGHTVTMSLCYYGVPGKTAPLCFAGDTAKLGEDIKDWKKMSVSVPFEQFRGIPYRHARIHFDIDRGNEPGRNEKIGKAGFEGVLWADDFRFTLAERAGTGAYNVKRSGALWPDDYKGWGNAGRPREGLQAWKP